MKGSLDCVPWLALCFGHDVAGTIHEYLYCVTYCVHEVKRYLEKISLATRRDDKESYMTNLFDFLVVHQEFVWGYSKLRKQVGLKLEKLVNNECIEWDFGRIDKYNEAFGCCVQVHLYDLNVLFGPGLGESVE